MTDVDNEGEDRKAEGIDAREADIERVEESIEEARDKAEDAEHPLIRDEGQPYHEEGDIRTDLIDETIVPPA